MPYDPKHMLEALAEVPISTSTFPHRSPFNLFPRRCRQAESALQVAEIPVGCVIVDPSGQIIARGKNATNETLNVCIQLSAFHLWRDSELT